MRVFGSVEKVEDGEEDEEVEADGADDDASSVDDVDDVLASDAVLCMRSHGRACSAGGHMNNFEVMQ